jgi:hypothetical protein
MGKFVSQVVWPICRIGLWTIIARGILLWLAGRGYHPEKWVADMLSAATTPESLGAITWVMAGATGLAIPAIWRGLKFAVSWLGSNKQNRTPKSHPAPDPSQALIDRPKAPANWPIRELFFHIRPDLLDSGRQDLWDEVGMDVLDKLSTGQLKAYGRLADTGQTKPLTEIPKTYWGDARFTYWFLDKGHEQTVHVENKKAGMAYRDLRVSRDHALELWPRSLIDVSVRLFNAETTIGNCRAICAIQLTNIAQPTCDLNGCLVKIDQLTWPTPEGMPMPLVLRTEGQINRKDHGPFHLRATEQKTIPILYQAQPRKDEWFVFDENGKRHFLPSGARALLVGVYGARTEGKVLIDVRVGAEFRAEAELTIVPDGYSLVGHKSARSFTANPNDPDLMQLRRDITWLAEMLSRYEPLGPQRSEAVERYERVERSDHPIWLLNPAKQLRRDFLNRCGRAIASNRRDYIDQRERDETVGEMWDAAEKLEQILSNV